MEKTMVITKMLYKEKIDIITIYRYECFNV